uniref:BRCT domain-containing protein n=1 Tax=Arundo donax TaxID=35708 RepID=A0A0A8ZHV8_ARUDO
MASPSGDDDIGDVRLFDGVRFVLTGFDDDAEAQYRSEMVRRGDVDTGRFGNRCTHVVVWDLVYVSWICNLVRGGARNQQW